MLFRSRKPRGASRYVLYTAAALLLLGSLGAFTGAQTWRWPQTDARILVSDGRTATSRSAEIRYSYSVGGRDYIGGAVQPYDFGLQNWFLSPHQAHRYRENAPVRVSYDPADASVAVLEPGPSGISLMLLGAGILVGLCGAWMHSRSRRPT